MKVIKFVALMAVALGLAACGSDDPSDSATTNAPAASAAPAGTDGEPADAGGLQLLDTGLGKVLGNSEGVTVYLFTPDARGDSTCYDECEANWPFLAEVSDVGEGLDASLLGTTERTTGETQATYNGWPLYTFAGDSGPGETNGQGVGDAWYVIDATGNAIDNY